MARASNVRRAAAIASAAILVTYQVAAQAQPEIHAPDTDIFDAVGDAYDREEAEGNFITDDEPVETVEFPDAPEPIDPAETETIVPDDVEIDDTPMTEDELDALRDADDPFGPPEQYGDESDEPLPDAEPEA
jgi:hypothetical protein